MEQDTIHLLLQQTIGSAGDTILGKKLPLAEAATLGTHCSLNRFLTFLPTGKHQIISTLRRGACARGQLPDQSVFFPQNSNVGRRAAMAR